MKTKHIVLLMMLLTFIAMAGCMNGESAGNGGGPVKPASSDGGAEPAIASDSNGVTVTGPAGQTGAGPVGKDGDRGVVEITGNYTRFDGIKGFDGDYQYLSMIGETDGHIVMQYMPVEYSKEVKPSLMLVDIDALEIARNVKLYNVLPEIGENPVSHTRVAGDKIIVCLEGLVAVFDESLELINEIPLPEAIVRKAGRTVTYDRNGIIEVFYGGYDISDDLRKIVYTDETGIWLYDLGSGTEELLAENIYNEDYLKRSFYRFPRFIADSGKIIADRLGYEYSLGYAVLSIAGKSLQTLDLFSERGMNDIYYDTGLLEPETNMLNKETGDYERKSFYLDFETGNVTEIQIEKSIYDRYPFRDNFYVGENYAAFVTCIWADDGDYYETRDDMFYLNRIDLNTLEIETDLLSVMAGGPHILGVLADGRILFRYYYDETDNGVCIAR